MSNSFRFRPTITHLEDRAVPSLTPAEVFAAVDQTDAAQKQLAHYVEKTVAKMNVFTVRDLRTYLPALTVDNLESAAIFGRYQNQLEAQAPTEPSVIPTLNRVRQLRYKAEVNALYAFALTQQVNGIPVNTVAAPIPANQPIPNPYISRVPVTVAPPVPETPETPDPTPETPDLTSTGLSIVAPAINTPDYVTQTSGLQIFDVNTGVGDPVVNGQDVTVFYTGWLAEDGTEFDSNYVGEAVPAPTTFNTAGVIEGFREGLIGMRPGGTRRIFIPSALGYGSAGSGASIPPDSDLIFEIRLVSSTTPTTQR